MLNRIIKIFTTDNMVEYTRHICFDRSLYWSMNTEIIERLNILPTQDRHSGQKKVNFNFIETKYFYYFVKLLVRCIFSSISSFNWNKECFKGLVIVVLGIRNIVRGSAT